jgi:hypothetical protein
LYGFVERPASLPADFEASGGTSLRFMLIKAIDGFRMEAALWQPAEKTVVSNAALLSPKRSVRHCLRDVFALENRKGCALFPDLDFSTPRFV